jgi:flagellar motor protein MotB
MNSLRRYKVYHTAAPGVSWQSPTLALFLILLAFFIIMSQMSQVQGQKFKAMQQSVYTALQGDVTNKLNQLASGGVDPKSPAAIQDIVAGAYNDIIQVSKTDWEVVKTYQEKSDNSLTITLNPPAILLDDTSPYPPEQRLSGILATKIKSYHSQNLIWQINILAPPPQDNISQQSLSQGLARFARALISRGLQPAQVSIGFNANVPLNTIQLQFLPQAR